MNTDVRGSTTNVIRADGTSVTGFVYDEFGNQIKTGESDFIVDATYTGSIYDEETELQYMNSRYYDPGVGRFISRDSYLGSSHEPWTQHLYGYTGGNPVNFVDPTGHFASAIAVGGYLLSKVLFDLAVSAVMGYFVYDAITGSSISNHNVSGSSPAAAASGAPNISVSPLLDAVIFASINIAIANIESMPLPQEAKIKVTSTPVYRGGSSISLPTTTAIGNTLVNINVGDISFDYDDYDDCRPTREPVGRSKGDRPRNNRNQNRQAERILKDLQLPPNAHRLVHEALKYVGTEGKYKIILELVRQFLGLD